MAAKSRGRSLLLAVLALSVAFGTIGCTGSLLWYPKAEEPGDLAGIWVHGPGELELNADGTFRMTDMPEWVTEGRSGGSESAETVSCTGTWSLFEETQNIDLWATSGECRGGQLFATGRAGQMTIAFGVDGGSDDPRCFELVRSSSKLKPRNTDECLTY